MQSSVKDNPYDIDGNSFNAEMYTDRLLKFGTLKQIMDKESEIIGQSQYLQSEMQTLVYENYNKFISATDTVRKMRADFKNMQDEMVQLNENMDKITKFSEKISSSLKESGSNVSRLCATRQLLDRLQFLFLLPSQLSTSIAKCKYSEAVENYVHAQRVLQRYGGQPSFGSIQVECEDIINRLKVLLRERLVSSETSASDLAESARLLVQLQASEESLSEVFLSCAETRMMQHLDGLQNTIDCVDVLEWVEKCDKGILADLGIIVSSYREMFLECGTEEQNIDYIVQFADRILDNLFNLAKNKFVSSSNSGTEILIRGLDKFYRHLQAMMSVIHSDSISTKAMDIVLECITNKGETHYTIIKNQFKDSLIRVRQTIVGKGNENSDLKEIVSSLQTYTIEKVQASLQDLTIFLQPGLSFSLKPPCINAVAEVCWRLVVNTLTSIADVVKGFSTPLTSTNSTPFELLLILAKLCLELQCNGLNILHAHMQTLLEEVSPGEKVLKRDFTEVSVALSTAVQAALDAEVVFIGQSAAQMLRVSVLARDWLRAPEPRGPRAVCRRVVEALASADAAAAQLFPAGNKQSSDSSRRTLWPRAPSSFSPLNRIFSERIEVFGPAGADRAALSAGALKVALKALVECVRLRTFGRHGLQQLQVDVHFLQQRLACLGNDERLLSALLQDALASAQMRCVDPQLMEPSIVDVICERG